MLHAMGKDHPNRQIEVAAAREEHGEIAGVQAKPWGAPITLRVGHMLDRY